MAKITIDISDAVNEGTVHISVLFDPPIKEGDDLSAAQSMGIEFLEVLQDLGAAPEVENVDQGE